MHTCDTCQALMLEYLYDLLDGDDRQAFEAHLQGCSACQAARVKAQGQQRLLATAAKMEFPTVHFTAPAEADIPTVVPLPQPKPRRWLRWVAAAAVLLALAGVAVPAWWYGADYVATRQAVEQQEQKLAQARERLKKVNDERAAANQEYVKKINDLQEARLRREVKMVVTGPRNVQAGAPAEYLVQTYDLNNQPAPAEIVARLADTRGAALPTTAPIKPVEKAPKDAKGKEAEGLKVVKVREGAYRVLVPPTLQLRGDNQMTLLVSAKRDSGSHTQLSEQVRLTAPVYFTHLTTDKPMYQPGETVYFRSLTLDRSTLKPAVEDFRLHFVLTPPNGAEQTILQGSTTLVSNVPGKSPQVVLGPDKKPLRGIGSGAYPLPETADGGEYTLILREELGRFPEQKRKFIVNRYQKPQINLKLDYNKRSYGPGDEVVARCKATRAAGGAAIANCPVQATVIVDDKTYGADGKPSAAPLTLRTDGAGVVNVRFRLPGKIDKGLASLAVKFEDKADVRPIVRPLPIVLKKLKVEFFPEGGDLAAGLVNRVYFEVRTPLGKPADLKGHLLEDGKPLPVRAETLTDADEPGVNQGMGRFTFTPKAKHKYELAVDSPTGITQRFALPEVKDDKVVLQVTDGVVASDKPIRVVVRSVKPKAFLVGAYCRGRLLDSVRLEKGASEAELKPEGGAGGVCRVTVFEELPGPGPRRELKPVAERLIYRRPKESLNLTLRPDRKAYVPGQKVKLDVEAKNEKGEAVPAVALVAVVDKSVVMLADDKTDRTMPTHFLLTTEVRRAEDLEYADFLLGTHPKAAAALDLLLGTQGWRRFAEQDPVKFRQQHQDKAEADRLLVTIGQSGPETRDLSREERQQVDDEFDARVARLESDFEEADENARTVAEDDGYKAAVVKVASYQRFLSEARSVGVPVLAALLVLGGLVCLVVALLRGAARALPYYLSAAACAALVFVVLKLPAPGPAPAADGGKQVAKADIPPRPFLAREAERPTNDKAATMFGAPGTGTGGGGFMGGPGAMPNGMRGGMMGMMGGMAVPMAPGFAPPRPTAMPPGMKMPIDGKGGVRQGVAARGEGKNKALAEQRGRRQKDFAFAKKGVEQAAGAAKAKRPWAGKGVPAMRPGMPPPGLPPRFPGGFPGGGPALNRQLRDRMAMDARFRQVLPPLPPLVVREYAHVRTHGADESLRTDFTETVFWHPVLVLPGGKGDVSFELCDSTTTFQATVFAHTLDGRLGSATGTITARLPFSLQAKTPMEVTAGDKIDIPLTVANSTDEARAVELKLAEYEGLTLVRGDAQGTVKVPANTAVRKFYRFQPRGQEGDVSLTFEGTSKPFAPDKFSRGFKVVPEGFPVVRAHSDVLEGSATQTVLLPETWIKGTLKCRVQVYPSTLADLQKGLDALLREPGGCFEQTSTSNYPNLLILNYIKESDQAKPAVERRARDLLARGYQKLTAFECLNTGKKKREGYEWFGGTAPAHEALTAYGLMEFRDMAKVYDVDPAMVRRTQQYLMSRRDGKGGFLRNPRAIDTFGRAPDNVTNAYIVWALTEGGKDDDVTKELNALADQAKTSKDPYFLSLVANSLVNRARTADALKLLEAVAKLQKEDGHLDAAQTSITGSGGRDLQIETTALAVLGWLKAQPGAFNVPLRKAVQWIGKQRGGYGGFGSTQSTILALKALIAYTKANKKTPEAGELSLFVGEERVASLPFAAGAAEALELAVPEVEKHLKPGRNKVRVAITGKNVFPYTVSWSYQSLKPPSDDKCPVQLSTRLAKADAKEGDTVRLSVSVENVSGKGQGMAVAILGLPAGMNVPEDLKQLKEYTRVPEDGSRPLLSYFELRGRELVLYWRDMAPGQKIEVPVDLVCRVPGEYRGPANRAYLYYNADLKSWTEPLAVKIAAKEE